MVGATNNTPTERDLDIANRPDVYHLPGSRLLLPTLCLPKITHYPNDDPAAARPRADDAKRRRTHKQNRTHRINNQRTLNTTHPPNATNHHPP
jgi:hypothetical protein